MNNINWNFFKAIFEREIIIWLENQFMEELQDPTFFP